MDLSGYPQLVQDEVEKLNELEVNVQTASDRGIFNGKEMTSAQQVALFSEQRRLIELRATLLGLIRPEGGEEYGH